MFSRRCIGEINGKEKNDSEEEEIFTGQRGKNTKKEIAKMK